MRRIRITVAYDGTEFQGWQVQPGLPTIQGILEETVSAIEGETVHVAGSGRTDAGVHALAQVAAFNLSNPIPARNLKKAMNALLPSAIRILDCEEAHPEFHPRFDAIDKTYEYRIWTGEVCPPHQVRYLHHHPYPRNWETVAALAPVLEGEHNFGAFASADTRDQFGRSKVRRIYSSRFSRTEDHCAYRVTGSGFLKHMVRNIVGTLLEAGKGNLDERGLRELLVSGRRTEAGPTAPAKGLFLIDVRYPHDHIFRPVGPSA